MNAVDLKEILSNYKLTENEIDEIFKVVNHIYIHPEFQKRLTKEFLHHGNMTLGQHIIEDTITTYKLSKKYLNNNNYRLDLALKISMFHDLYTMPWQNNELAKENRFTNKHGFRHPVEAVINGIYMV